MKKNNKKYHITVGLWTGSWYQNGELEYGREITIKSNNLDYVWKRIRHEFGECNLAFGKVRLIKDYNSNFDF